MDIYISTVKQMKTEFSQYTPNGTVAIFYGLSGCIYLMTQRLYGLVCVCLRD